MNIDFNVTNFIYNFHNSFLDSLFVFITTLGDYMIIWIVITLLLFILKKLSLKKDFIFISLVYFSSFLVNDLILKQLFQRDRPFMQYEIFQPLILAPDSHSFPSGHTASSFVAATILSYYFPKYRVLFYVLAIIIGFSRIYVGVHFLSDVLVGALIGFVIAKTGILIKTKIDSNFKQQKI